MSKDSIEKFLLKIKKDSTKEFNRSLIKTFIKNIKFAINEVPNPSSEILYIFFQNSLYF